MPVVGGFGQACKCRSCGGGRRLVDVSRGVYASGTGEDLVVILHGLGCSKQSFAPLWTALESWSVSVLAPDLPGHGLAATVSDEFLTVSGMAAYVSRIVGDHDHRCSRVHVIGHSLGGAVGLHLVQESPIPVVSFVNVEGNLVSSDCGASRAIAGSQPQDAARTGASVVEALGVENHRPSYQLWAGWLENSPPAALHATAGSLVAESDHGRLLQAFTDLAIPKTYVYGSDSANPKVLQLLRDITAIRIADADHLVMEDQPAQFTQAVIEWLQPQLGHKTTRT